MEKQVNELYAKAIAKPLFNFLERTSNKWEAKQVFDHGIQLYNDNKILYLTYKNHERGAFSLVLPQKEYHEFCKGIVVGSEVENEQGVLCFHGNTLNIHGALQYNCYQDSDGFLTKKVVQAFIEELKFLLHENMQRNKISSSIFGEGENLDNLPSTLQELQEILTGKSKNSEAIIHLLGRGEGMTPTGDDILLGTILMHPENKYLSEIICSKMEEATTRTSCHLLKLAMQEQCFNQNLIHMYEALHDKELDKAVITNLVYQILGMGHSSGQDVLIGIYLAASAQTTHY